MRRRLFAGLVLAASACSSYAWADLTIPVRGKEAPPAVKAIEQPQPRPKMAAAPAPVPRRQIGVARRGTVPVLPAADGTAVPPFPDVAPPPTGPQLPPMLVQVTARLGRMIAPATDIYRLPDPRSQWVGKVKQGQQIAIVSQWQGWFAIIMGDGSQAYVPQTHVEVLPYEVKSVTPARPETPTPQTQPASYERRSDADFIQTASNETARRVIEEALSYRGTRYVYGGNSRSGVDCSGLVRNCFSANGMSLPRRASEQARIGQEVPLDQLQPGDRLYFSVRKAFDHTGIYLGDGNFIHAGSSRGNVGVDSLSKGLYARTLAAARR
jgi:cell wall-associated NlpC family hydrolase